MYLLDSMIELGLKDGQKWPTEAHRRVACNLAIGNPMVKTRDALTELVQKVCAIPESQIRRVTMAALPKYGINITAYA